MPSIKKVAIVGLGLIGGSLGMAIKQKALAEEVMGIPRRQETLDQAKAKGAIDSGTLSVEEGIKDADLIFICTPLGLILSKLQEISPFLKKGAMVTDVGSAKFEIVKAAEKIMPKGVFFVGGHPMAGKEESGIEAAEAGLFENRPYILTPTARTSKKALEQISAFVSALGVNLLELDPRTHDLVVAAVSHLPLAAAAGVVDAVLKKKEIEAEIKKCASSGFRDTTRVASGDPQLGRDIFLSNRKPVLVLIRELVRSLKTLEKLIRAADGEQILLWLKQAKEFRDSSLKTLRE